MTQQRPRYRDTVLIESLESQDPSPNARSQGKVFVCKWRGSDGRGHTTRVFSSATALQGALTKAHSAGIPGWFDAMVEDRGQYHDIVTLTPVPVNPPASPTPAQSAIPERGKAQPWRTRPPQETESIERNTALQQAAALYPHLMGGLEWGDNEQPGSMEPHLDRLTYMAEVFASFIHRQVWSAEPEPDMEDGADADTGAQEGLPF